MQRFTSLAVFLGVVLVCTAAASSNPETHPLPPVDAFTIHDGARASSAAVATASPSAAEDVREPPSVAPLPPNVGPHPNLPPDPAYRPDAEPIRIEPAASAMGTLSESDRDFARRAAEFNNSEIALGKLAVWRADQADVSQFGQQMINTHIAANSALHTLLEGRNMALPTGLDKEHQAARAHFGKISGAQFDREYIRMELKDHTTATQMFHNEAEHGHDAWLRGWASQMVPTLEHNLQQLRDLSDTVKPGV